MPNLFVISEPNGAGKTTAASTIVPEIFNCKEFVNAHNIAVGLSPFNPEGVSLEAGRIMLQRVQYLSSIGADCALETTLASKNYYRQSNPRINSNESHFKSVFGYF